MYAFASVCVSLVSVLFSMSLLSLSGDPPSPSSPSTHPLLCICGLLDSIDQPVKACMSEEEDTEREEGRLQSGICVPICVFQFVRACVCGCDW